MGPQATVPLYLYHHCARAIHHSADGLFRLLHITYLAPEEDHIYELIERPNLWDLKTPAVQDRLCLMPSRLQIQDGLLYKLMSSSWLP